MSPNLAYDMESRQWQKNETIFEVLTKIRGCCLGHGDDLKNISGDVQQIENFEAARFKKIKVHQQLRMA